MPAADYATLYDFEGQLETAFAAALTAASLTNYKSLDTTDKDAPFVVVQATVGAGHRKYTDISKGNEAFDFEIELQICTNRTETSAGTNHATYRGKVRNVMERWLASQTGGSGMNARLTYLIIDDLARTGGGRGVDSNERFDITTETYSGVFRIKADAWPS